MLQNLNEDYESWFDNEPRSAHFRGKRLIRVNFKGWNVNITPLLYYEADGDMLFATNTDGSGWAAHVEKAYVVLRGKHTYSSLDASKSPDPPSTDQIMMDLVGRHLHIEVGNSEKESAMFFNADERGRTTTTERLTASKLKATLGQAKSRATTTRVPLSRFYEVFDGIYQSAAGCP